MTKREAPKPLPVEGVELPRATVTRLIRQNTKFTDEQLATFVRHWEQGKRGTSHLRDVCSSTSPTILKIKKILVDAWDPVALQVHTGKLSPEAEAKVEAEAGPPVKDRDQAQQMLDRLIAEAEANGDARVVAELTRVRASITPEWRETDAGASMDPEKWLGKRGLEAMGEKFVGIFGRLAAQRELIPSVWNQLHAIALSNPPVSAFGSDEPIRLEVDVEVEGP